MKTWLTTSIIGNSKNKTVFRQFEGGGYPDWIGDLFKPTNGNPSFFVSGENRVFTQNEIKQISIWLDEMND